MNRFLAVLAFVVLAPFIGGFLTGLDRKITAHMQGRKGPPLMQPFYDVSKLLKNVTRKIHRYSKEGCIQ